VGSGNAAALSSPICCLDGVGAAMNMQSGVLHVYARKISVAALRRSTSLFINVAASTALSGYAAAGTSFAGGLWLALAARLGSAVPLRSVCAASL